jgi:serine/threonine protein kinase
MITKVDNNWKVKLSGFDLAIFSTQSEELLKVVGTTHWCDPNVFFGRPYTDKSDIYSMSITFWVRKFVLSH